jgi:hypothetical protein
MIVTLGQSSLSNESRKRTFTCIVGDAAPKYNQPPLLILAINRISARPTIPFSDRICISIDHSPFTRAKQDQSLDGQAKHALRICRIAFFPGDAWWTLLFGVLPHMFSIFSIRISYSLLLSSPIFHPYGDGISSSF